MHTMIPYFLLGISLAAPIGPVKATLLNLGIKNGFFHAWFFSLGAIATDLTYMFLVYLGIGRFIEYPFIKSILWSFGCFVLLYTGIENLLTMHKVKLNSNFKRIIRLRHSFISGFLIALLNPLTILFWLGIYGSVLVGGSNLNTFEIGMYSVCILLGILLVDFIMASISSGSRKILSSNFLNVVSAVSSISMIGFGIHFGILAYKSLF
ncbi:MULTISPECIES: LysE family transporter [unclassified Rummeliibacillus]|uniref:LysE family transporter n=1 Tax=unclassified Rummeliibacillus TaxID=2622809 RepID=UPI000E6663E0|nr:MULTISPECIES: LysE family transporter [unclassified Rummeliibacillus]RIJ62906.1 amino acid transporter [Rummeliibacillus sp. POC4]RPJ94198.1 amino acid transporter [Rummeliibacillus sp. TYF005]